MGRRCVKAVIGTAINGGSLEQIYSALKGNIDAAAQFTEAQIGAVQVVAKDISSRQLQLAVPAGTTAAQWQQIESAMQYGASQGVKVVVTVVK